MEGLTNVSDSVKKYSTKAIDTTDRVLTKSLGFLSNNYLRNLILVLLILYAPLAAPMAGQAIAKLLNNYAVKFIYIFLLAYLLSKSVKVALASAVIIVVGIFILKKLNINYENFENSQEELLLEPVLKKEPVINRAELTKSLSELTGMDMVDNYNNLMEMSQTEPSEEQTEPSEEQKEDILSTLVQELVEPQVVAPEEKMLNGNNLCQQKMLNGYSGYDVSDDKWSSVA